MRVFQLQGKNNVSYNIVYFRCSNLTQRVQIGDQNDHTPLMNTHEETVLIEENVEIGTKVVTIEATDADKPDKFGKITFSLDGSDNFAIDEDTGVISVINEIDYEIQTSYNVSI